jgi:hypothetical protein
MCSQFDYSGGVLHIEEPKWFFTLLSFPQNHSFYNFFLTLLCFSIQVGNDAHGNLLADALRDGGVRLDYLTIVPSAPTGHAVVMLQSSGQNSIVIVGGTNMSCWPQILPPQHLEVVSSAGIVLLQREIPDFVNVQVAKVGTLHFLLRKWEIVFFSFIFY